jgi:DNA topoisomerase VI subunit B
MEFFTEKELQMRLGYSKSNWPIVLLKELIDNSLDACENAGIQPEVEITLEPDSLSVLDNGPGIPIATVEGSLDYSIRTSDKSYYVSPTRGQLGNALKCLWAAPFVANGKLGQVEISAHSTIHYIEVRLDPIAQQPKINYTTKPCLVKTGTFTKIHWPEIASYQGGAITTRFYNLVENFSLLNPHARLVLKLLERKASSFEPSIPSWQKWVTSQPTSPHWYSVSQLCSLIAAYLTNSKRIGRPKPIREFVAEFAGLTGTAKQKSVLNRLQLSGAYLNDLIKDGNIDSEKVAQLLDAMKDESRPIAPKNLGIITEKHIFQWLQRFSVLSFPLC